MAFFVAIVYYAGRSQPQRMPLFVNIDEKAFSEQAYATVFGYAPEIDIVDDFRDAQALSDALRMLLALGGVDFDDDDDRVEDARGAASLHFYSLCVQRLLSEQCPTYVQPVSPDTVALHSAQLFGHVKARPELVKALLALGVIFARNIRPAYDMLAVKHDYRPFPLLPAAKLECFMRSYHQHAGQLLGLQLTDQRAIVATLLAIYSGNPPRIYSLNWETVQAMHVPAQEIADVLSSALRSCAPDVEFADMMTDRMLHLASLLIKDLHVTACLLRNAPVVVELCMMAEHGSQIVREMRADDEVIMRFEEAGRAYLANQPTLLRGEA